MCLRFYRKSFGTAVVDMVSIYLILVVGGTRN